MHVALRSCQLKRAFSLISGLLHNTLHDRVIEIRHMLCTAASICAIDLLQNKFQLRIPYWGAAIELDAPLRNNPGKLDF